MAPVGTEHNSTGDPAFCAAENEFRLQNIAQRHCNSQQLVQMKRPAEMRYLKKLQKENAEVARIRKRWQDEEEAHLLRADEMQAKIDELEARLHSKNLAQEDRQQGGGDWLEERLYLQRQELWWLNQRVHKTEEGSKFARPKGPVEERDLTDAIDKAMDSIRFELESFTWGQRTNYLHCPKKIKYKELGAHLRSAHRLGDY